MIVVKVSTKIPLSQFRTGIDEYRVDIDGKIHYVYEISDVKFLSERVCGTDLKLECTDLLSPTEMYFVFSER